MSKEVAIKYECGQCYERHDSEDGAYECCQPEVSRSTSARSAIQSTTK